MSPICVAAFPQHQSLGSVKDSTEDSTVSKWKRPIATGLRLSKNNPKSLASQIAPYMGRMCEQMVKKSKLTWFI
ncbi:hypothetical protein CEXT_126111 [Caerostris extrusa]|uniref:Uncharacterized protein n=1 Tax=Caerostris extrusa TaxID=172846 RepID=A0AAV4QWE0_CAEEX|nr:hypothetical protein CEXT_126111 [Caerostris extrusa]